MSDITIVEDIFDIAPPDVIKRFTMTNSSGFSAQIITYGATLTTLKVPDKNGQLDDIVLGYDDIAGYQGYWGPNPYFGASIGRTSNRIARGRFTLDGVQYQLSLNDGPNNLHGGLRGFDKRIWVGSINQENNTVTFSYTSADGEEGYPGQVMAQITFQVTADNQLIIRYLAMTSKPTSVGLTHHSYFNLAGHQNSDKELAGHRIQIFANEFTPVDDNLIITGEIKQVDGTVFDLRTETDLHEILKTFPPDGPYGYDNNLCLIKDQTINLAATIWDTTSGRRMDIITDQPGLQFYTSNQMSPTEPIIGKSGARYLKHGAFAAETQNYPDAVNHPHFPNPFLRPGQVYTHVVHYKFSTFDKTNGKQ